MTENKIELQELYSLIAQKIEQQDSSSYSYELAKTGIEKINRKIGEEALEVVIASFIYKNEKSGKNRQDLIAEIADLFYHNLVLLAANQINFDEILQELSNRNKVKK